MSIGFKGKIRIAAWNSFVGGSALVLLLINLLFIRKEVLTLVLGIIYIITKIVESVNWRCPKCFAKLPKGKAIYKIKECENCHYNLKNA